VGAFRLLIGGHGVSFLILGCGLDAEWGRKVAEA
jgi:hypothetical protein